ncbi:helix-turn-helix transcriptional regulator [Desulfosporosinus sp. PR]|uniref:helix-turn-helix domain-containing protein n=1 Tax=Candidatus Desulfosporosinus nitrosoreducens TaxID=3401928 RepID=UPI0027EF6E19|nr:helix-turn-helix transcriptional regulator [Desulfosporosinus sp. PR]MDQ7092938.1 helix-turn-helix transcriptional regulator [Desulfosporosinus sp. PR]
MIIINKSVCKRISLYRRNSKLTQEELAAKVGVRFDHLSEIEAGSRIPRISELAQLAAGLNIPIDELLKNKDGSS